MVSKNEARWQIEDSHQELVSVLNLLTTAVPDLIEDKKLDELHTLLDMSFSAFRCHLGAIEIALKHLRPSSVQKLT